MEGRRIGLPMLGKVGRLEMSRCSGDLERLIFTYAMGFIE